MSSPPPAPNHHHTPPGTISRSRCLLFPSPGTSRHDYGFPSTGDCADFADLSHPAENGLAPLRKHRPARRSWAGDPWAMRARRKSDNATGGAGCRGAAWQRATQRGSNISNTLTWRGATFPWVSGLSRN